MTQFTDYGYSQVRNYIKTTFKTIGLYSGTTQQKVIANPTITENASTITYTVVVDNADGSLNAKAIDNAKLIQTAGSTDAVAIADFTSFTFQSTDDTLTVVINIQVPTI